MRRWTVQGGVESGGGGLVGMGGGCAAGPTLEMGGSLLDRGSWNAAAAGGVSVVWTGSLAQVEGGGLFEPHPRTWGPAGWGALGAACAEHARWRAGTTLIRPHARHVVSDIPGIRRFAATLAEPARAPGRWGLLLDPASMLDTAHFDRHGAEDTLRRIAAELPTLDTPELPLYGLVVANLRRVEGGLAVAPIDEGLIDPGLIRGLFGGA